MTACGGGVEPQIVARTTPPGAATRASSRAPARGSSTWLSTKLAGDRRRSRRRRAAGRAARRRRRPRRAGDPASVAISGSGSTPIASCPTARAAPHQRAGAAADVEQAGAGRQVVEQRRERAPAQPREAARIGLGHAGPQCFSHGARPYARRPTAGSGPRSPQPDRAARDDGRRRAAGEVGGRRRRRARRPDSDWRTASLARRGATESSRCAQPPPGTGTLCTRTSYWPSATNGGGSGVVVEGVGRLVDGRARRRRRRPARTSPERSRTAAPEPPATNVSIPGSSTTTSARCSSPAAYQTTGQRVRLLAHLRRLGTRGPPLPAGGEHGDHRQPRRSRATGAAATPVATRLLGPGEPHLGRVARIEGAYAVGCRLARSARQPGALAHLGPERHVDVLVARPVATTTGGSRAASRATASRASSAGDALVLEAADQVGPAGVDVRAKSVRSVVPAVTRRLSTSRFGAVADRGWTVRR